MSSSLLKLLINNEGLTSIVSASQLGDITPLILSISSKLCNTVIKTGDSSLAFIIFRDANLNKTSLNSLLNSLFVHYLNIEKSKKNKISPLFCELLSMLWQRYGEDMLNLIPTIISEVSTTETKPRLYGLVSQALSGMPFDTANDLPLVLALNQSNPEIRKHALEEIKDVKSFETSLKLLIEKEQDYDVLLAALNLNLGQEFYQVLIDKYEEFSKYISPPVECLRRLFQVITQENQNITIQHVKVILIAYDNPQLRDLCPEAVSKARTYKIFKDYKGQDLSLFLQQKLIKS